MFRPIALAAFVTLLPALAHAGEVFGTIKGAAGPVGEGAQVAAQCGGNQYGPVTTDKKGTYRLVIGQVGKCTLTITHEGRSATVDVVSFDDAAQADIVLTVDGGKLSARRG
jgi:hypothetical protein